MSIPTGHIQPNVERALVLVIDDSVDVVRLLALILSATCDVIFATNGAQGLELARRRLPDLILLDVEMPGMDGRQVWRALQTAPELRQIPVVFVSAEDPRRHPEMDAVGWIRKPFSAQVVQNDVRGRLRQVRQL